MALVFQRDPCGILCILVTYITLLYADYCIVTHVVLPTLSDTLWGSLHVLIFNFLLFLIIYSHLKASLGDPGCVPFPEVAVDFSEARRSSRKRKDVTNDDWTMCKFCEMYRPPRSHHCRVCQRCIKRMDHHCPWINNCVGEENQKFFLLFCFYTGISCLYSIVLTVCRWSHACIECTRNQRQNRRVHSIVLILLCGFYCIFVLCILFDQLSGIFKDVTTIEQVQKKMARPPKSKLALLTGVCGRGSYYKWFIPWLPPKFDSDDVIKTFPV